jgi:hypothetical protein
VSRFLREKFERKPCPKFLDEFVVIAGSMLTGWTLLVDLQPWKEDWPGVWTDAESQEQMKHELNQEGG